MVLIPKGRNYYYFFQGTREVSFIITLRIPSGGNQVGLDWVTSFCPKLVWNLVSS